MKRILLTVTALCLMAGVQAQKLYNLQYCLELGLQNNYDLRIAHNNQQIDANNATWAHAGLLPTLDFSAGYTLTFRIRQDTRIVISWESCFFRSCMADFNPSV